MLGPAPASPAVGCSGPAGLQGLPSAVGHAGMSCCPCSHKAEAGSTLPPSPELPGRRGCTPALGCQRGVGLNPTPCMHPNLASPWPSLSGSSGTP